jgi:hypothetical protein
MAMGKRRRRAKQTSMWVATQDLPRSAAHPFYARLNQILDQHDFGVFVEGLCEARAAVYQHRRRIRGTRDLRLVRQRGERLERSFAHLNETGGMRACICAVTRTFGSAC